MWRNSEQDDIDYFGGGGPSLRTCRHCGRRFYSELMPFCCGQCADAYDDEYEMTRYEEDEEQGGEG